MDYRLPVTVVKHTPKQPVPVEITTEDKKDENQINEIHLVFNDAITTEESFN
jgi:hypothetical protein